MCVHLYLDLRNILDDGDGNLSVDEFSIGLRKMKGEAKSIDVSLLVVASRFKLSCVSYTSIFARYESTCKLNVKRARSANNIVMTKQSRMCSFLQP